MTTARQWLDRIRALDLPRTFKVMNVCGGHERSITMAGLRGALPASVEIVPGPGCPVCVCPEEAVHEAIQLARRGDVTLVAFGDMLRVPVNVPKGEIRSLEQAKAAGADVRSIASPMEAVRIARDDPARQVVFFAAGFETTTAPVAAMLAEGVPENLSVLLAGRLTWPAVAIREDPPEDERLAPATVDCDARMHVCHAVCCRLKFPLSAPEIGEATVKWDIGHPYLIRHESDGYCTHNDRSAHGCMVYERRPTVCRTYSCVGDKRIWADFDAMELNHAWIEEHLGGDDGMYFDSVVASMEVPVELTKKPT